MSAVIYALGTENVVELLLEMNERNFHEKELSPQQRAALQLLAWRVGWVAVGGSWYSLTDSGRIVVEHAAEVARSAATNALTASALGASEMGGS